MSSTKLNTSQWLGIARVLGALSDFHTQGEFWVSAPDLYARLSHVEPAYVIHSVTDAVNLGYVKERFVTTDGKETRVPNGGIAQWHLNPGGYVARVPIQSECVVCKYDHNTTTRAFADAKLSRGPWAFVCVECFVAEMCKLGTGFGQLLLVRPND